MLVILTIFYFCSLYLRFNKNLPAIHCHFLSKRLSSLLARVLWWLLVCSNPSVKLRGVLKLFVKALCWCLTWLSDVLTCVNLLRPNTKIGSNLHTALTEARNALSFFQCNANLSISDGRDFLLNKYCKWERRWMFRHHVTFYLKMMLTSTVSSQLSTWGKQCDSNLPGFLSSSFPRQTFSVETYCDISSSSFNRWNKKDINTVKKKTKLIFFLHRDKAQLSSRSKVRPTKTNWSQRVREKHLLPTCQKL